METSIRFFLTSLTGPVIFSRSDPVALNSEKIHASVNKKLLPGTDIKIFLFDAARKNLFKAILTCGRSK